MATKPAVEHGPIISAYRPNLLRILLRQVCSSSGDFLLWPYRAWQCAVLKRTPLLPLTELMAHHSRCACSSARTWRAPGLGHIGRQVRPRARRHRKAAQSLQVQLPQDACAFAGSSLITQCLNAVCCLQWMLAALFQVSCRSPVSSAKCMSKAAPAAKSRGL
jgi:hypothetical protein